MDSSSSSWFNWMTRCTIHKRNMARRDRAVQNSRDTRPTLIRIGSVLTSQHRRGSNQSLWAQKSNSNKRDDTFSADEIISNTLFDDDDGFVLTYESINSPIATSIALDPSSFTPIIPISLTMIGIMSGSRMMVRYTNDMSRGFRNASSPLGYAMLAPLNAPNVGIPVPIVHSPGGVASNHTSWDKLASLLLRSMHSSWSSSSNKTRITLAVLLLTGYEVVAAAVLGPRSSLDKH
jgi:hypothetical protein